MRKVKRVLLAGFASLLLLGCGGGRLKTTAANQLAGKYADPAGSTLTIGTTGLSTGTFVDATNKSTETFSGAVSNSGQLSGSVTDSAFAGKTYAASGLVYISNDQLNYTVTAIINGQAVTAAGFMARQF